MGIYDTFATDKKLETEGKLFTFPANADGTIPGFRLARMSPSNPRYLKAVEHFSRVYKTELKLDILTEEQAFGPMLEVFVDTVLLGWDNIQNRDNKLIEYSRETAMTLMRELPDLYTVLRELAQQLAQFRSTEVKVNSGN